MSVYDQNGRMRPSQRFLLFSPALDYFEEADCERTTRLDNRAKIRDHNCERDQYKANSHPRNASIFSFSVTDVVSFLAANYMDFSAFRLVPRSLLTALAGPIFVRWPQIALLA